MGSNLIHCWCASMLFLALTLQGQPRNVVETPDENVQVIYMLARKYEFVPSQVRVKQGMRVQLKITAIDRDHGFTIVVGPHGINSSYSSDLEFAQPQGNEGWKLRKGKETTIEFVAKRTGTYDFRCSVACGIHHGSMKGQVVVEP